MTHRTVKVYFDEESWDLIEGLVMYNHEGKTLSRSQKIRSLIKNNLDSHQKDNYPLSALRKRLHRLELHMSDAFLESEPDDEKLSRIELKYLKILDQLREWKFEIKVQLNKDLKGWEE
jgi:hypothetical protein